ncbi:MAG: magnesium transporter CorA family protein [Actinobacteria bacterium]|nr:magnesium transporter CorA family protein [Actinomycetota bacterium]
MQHLYHVAAGGDRAEAAEPAELAAVRTAGGWCWLDVVDFTVEEAYALGRAFGFDAIAMEDVTDLGEFPKVDAYAGHTFVVAHGVAADPTRLRTAEYDAFIGPGYLVTFHREDLPEFAWVRERMREPGWLAGVGPDQLFARIAEAGAARFEPLIAGLEEGVLDTEARALAGDQTVVGDVQALRRDALMLRKIVGPLRDTFMRLGSEALEGVGERARLRFQSVRDHHFRIAESLDTAQAVLGAVLETYRSTVAEHANDVMKVLTVFAAVLLPMSLVAGVYGMNFARMPELGWRLGYLWALGVMALIGLGLWLYFVRRGFVGAPRWRRAPRVLGRGLVDLVRLTLKPIAGVAEWLAGRPGRAFGKAVDDEELAPQ